MLKWLPVLLFGIVFKLGEAFASDVPPATPSAPPPHATATSSAAPQAAGTPKSGVIPNGTPFPRWIPAPKFLLQGVRENETIAFDYQDFRYSIVLMFGTWNKRSGEIARILNNKFPQLHARRIGVLTVFSHDTPTQLLEWRETYAPKFKTGIAKMSTIEELRNPKVPTVWIVDSNGNLQQKIELPDDQAISGVLERLQQWTNF